MRAISLKEQHAGFVFCFETTGDPALRLQAGHPVLSSYLYNLSTFLHCLFQWGPEDHSLTRYSICVRCLYERSVPSGKPLQTATHGVKWGADRMISHINWASIINHVVWVKWHSQGVKVQLTTHYMLGFSVHVNILTCLNDTLHGYHFVFKRGWGHPIFKKLDFMKLYRGSVWWRDH